MPRVDWSSGGATRVTHGLLLSPPCVRCLASHFAWLYAMPRQARNDERMVQPRGGTLQHLRQSPAVLQRYSAALPGQPFRAWEELTGGDRTRIFIYDPELAQLLSGQAPASTEAAVVSGIWPDAIPSPAEREEQARQAEIEAILQGPNPWGEPARYDDAGNLDPGAFQNLTAQMRLLELSPQDAARLQQQAVGAGPTPSAQAFAGTWGVV